MHLNIVLHMFNISDYCWTIWVTDCWSRQSYATLWTSCWIFQVTIYILVAKLEKPFSNLHELAYLSLFFKKILVYWLEHLQNFHLKFYFRGEESHSSANKCMLKVIDDQDVTFEACDWSISICPDQESQCLWHLVSLYFRWPSTQPRWRTTRRPSRSTSR